MPRIVILGTGTDIGKTYVACRIARTLARLPRTRCVVGIKPIESGLPLRAVRADTEGQSEVSLGSRPEAPSDAELLAECSTPPFVCPAHAYPFEEAISPHRAARLLGQRISVEHCAAWIAERELQLTGGCVLDPAGARQTSWVLIESAGAVLSPLSASTTNLDLALRLDPALWILVAPDRLGVLHDLTATLEAMKHLGRLPDSIVLSQPGIPDSSTGSNEEELRDLGIANIDAVVAHGGEAPLELAQRIERLALERHR